MSTPFNKSLKNLSIRYKLFEEEQSKEEKSSKESTYLDSQEESNVELKLLKTGQSY